MWCFWLCRTRAQEVCTLTDHRLSFSKLWDVKAQFVCLTFAMCQKLGQASSRLLAEPVCPFPAAQSAWHDVDRLGRGTQAQPSHGAQLPWIWKKMAALCRHWLTWSQRLPLCCRHISQTRLPSELLAQAISAFSEVGGLLGQKKGKSKELCQIEPLTFLSIGPSFEGWGLGRGGASEGLGKPLWKLLGGPLGNVN